MITLGGDAELELVDSLDPFSEGIVFRCEGWGVCMCEPQGRHVRGGGVQCELQGRHVRGGGVQCELQGRRVRGGVCACVSRKAGVCPMCPKGIDGAGSLCIVG